MLRGLLKKHQGDIHDSELRRGSRHRTDSSTSLIPEATPEEKAEEELVRAVQAVLAQKREQRIATSATRSRESTSAATTLTSTTATDEDEATSKPQPQPKVRDRSAFARLARQARREEAAKVQAAKKEADGPPGRFRRLFDRRALLAIDQAFEGSDALRTSDDVLGLLPKIGIFPPLHHLEQALEEVGYGQAAPKEAMSSEQFRDVVQRLFWKSVCDNPSDEKTAFAAMGGGEEGAGLVGLDQLKGTVSTFNLDLRSSLPDPGQESGQMGSRRSTKSNLALDSWLPLGTQGAATDSRRRSSIMHRQPGAQPQLTFADVVDLVLENDGMATGTDTEGEDDDPTAVAKDGYEQFEQVIKSCQTPKLQKVDPLCRPEEREILRIRQQHEKAVVSQQAALSVMRGMMKQRAVRRKKEDEIAAKRKRAARMKELAKKKSEIGRIAKMENEIYQSVAKRKVVTLKHTLSKGNCHIDLTEPTQPEKKQKKGRQTISANRASLLYHIEARAAQLASKGAFSMDQIRESRRLINLRKSGKNGKWKRVFSGTDEAGVEIAEGDTIDYDVLDPMRPGNRHLLSQLKPHQLRSRMFMAHAVKNLKHRTPEHQEEVLALARCLSESTGSPLSPPVGQTKGPKKKFDWQEEGEEEGWEWEEEEEDAGDRSWSFGRTASPSPSAYQLPPPELVAIQPFPTRPSNGLFSVPPDPDHPALLPVVPRACTPALSPAPMPAVDRRAVATPLPSSLTPTPLPPRPATVPVRGGTPGQGRAGKGRRGRKNNLDALVNSIAEANQKRSVVAERGGTR